jgi:hypothetical protein
MPHVQVPSGEGRIKGPGIIDFTKADSSIAATVWEKTLKTITKIDRYFILINLPFILELLFGVHALLWTQEKIINRIHPASWLELFAKRYMNMSIFK